MNKKYQALYETSKNEKDAIKRLKDIISILRKECPWDKVQTHETLTVPMIEEAYEVVEAINNKDVENLREELGDVLLQVVFHSSLSEEEEDFTLTDVINDECEKMIRRHPHIFSDENAKSIDKVVEKWENIKGHEHQGESHTDSLKRVPLALPALMRSEKVQSRAARAGFDWEDITGPLDKLNEEIHELEEACDKQDESSIIEEFGDLLFSMVNVSRYLKINPEEALNRCTDKFIKRFEYIELVALKRGTHLEDMSLKEMDELWDEAKINERNKVNLLKEFEEDNDE